MLISVSVHSLDSETAISKITWCSSLLTEDSISVASLLAVDGDVPSVLMLFEPYKAKVVLVTVLVVVVVMVIAVVVE